MSAAPQDILLQEEERRDVLESVALEAAAQKARRSGGHGSRLARLPAGSWRAQVIRDAAATLVAYTPQSLRDAMTQREGYVVFLPRDAIVTEDVIEKICASSPFDKLVVWENGNEPR